MTSLCMDYASYVRYLQQPVPLRRISRIVNKTTRPFHRRHWIPEANTIYYSSWTPRGYTYEVCGPNYAPPQYFGPGIDRPFTVCYFPDSG